MADTGSPFFIPYVEPTDLVRDYPAADEAQADAIAGQFALGFQFVGTRYYTSSGTFAKADPFGDSSFDGAKMRAIRVRVQAAGGGGGGAATGAAGSSAAGGGGAGGGYAERFVTDISGLDASVTVTRGGGGAGGVGDGSVGGTSEFGGVGDAWRTRATGGAGGITTGSTSSIPVSRGGNVGGVGSDGDLSVRGGASTGGFLMARASFASQGGTGGSSVLGGGGFGVQVVDNTFSNGNNGGDFGGGGSGALRVNAAADGTGGAGGNGIVIVDVFA